MLQWLRIASACRNDSSTAGHWSPTNKELLLAVEDSRRAIKLAPTWPTAWYRLIAVQRILGRNADALATGEAAARALGDGASDLVVSRKLRACERQALEAESARCLATRDAFLLDTPEMNATIDGFLRAGERS